MHGIYERMLKHWSVRISYLAVGLAFLLLSCVGAQDRAGSVEPGSGVRPGSNFATAADQITVTLSEPTLADDGGLKFFSTLTNSGSMEVCALASGISQMGVYLYDHTGSYELGAAMDDNDLVAATQEKADQVIPPLGGNRVIGISANIVIPSDVPASSRMPHFRDAANEVYREYRKVRGLTARSHLMVYPCHYSSIEAAWEAGEYATVFSQLVGPFKAPDGIFVSRNGR